MEVKAQRVAGWDDLKAPGQFLFTKRSGIEGYGGMVIACPCGCGRLAGVTFGQDGWTWNGDEEKPTLTPSLLRRECQWHGFLTDGVFRSC